MIKDKVGTADEAERRLTRRLGAARRPALVPTLPAPPPRLRTWS